RRGGPRRSGRGRRLADRADRSGKQRCAGGRRAASRRRRRVRVDRPGRPAPDRRGRVSGPPAPLDRLHRRRRCGLGGDGRPRRRRHRRGHADVVLLSYGSTARSDIRSGLRIANLSWGTRGPQQWETQYGRTLISKYAMAARRHMHDYGTTTEQLAGIAVSARFSAADNPQAAYRDPITVDDVLSGPVIADPFTKLHCCIRSDGGAAVVLVAEDRVPDLRKAPVFDLGSGEAVSHVSMSQWQDFTTGPTAVSGRLAFERAGVRPDDIDVCELYDAFTYMLLVTLEDLGFCKPGEGGPLAESGALRLGGALPTNTDGGGLSACHPGQRGLFLIVEAVRQLRGECGPRQVPDAELACVS